MGAPSVREVVIVPFPFSDLSQTKVRPALVLADAQRGDWMLCQITSSPYGDPTAVSVADADFETGGLSMHSYARPLKLFTLHQSKVAQVAGKLKHSAFRQIVDELIALLAAPAP
jgi:mRNA interferase MazF